MIEYKTGSIFDSTCDAIVNPVNCKGVMGKGLAKQFAQKYPLCLEEYRRHLRSGLLQIQQPTIMTEHDPKIIFFPTKVDWKNKSNLKDIDLGLYYLWFHQFFGLYSVAFPRLGCGLGGLKWDLVHSHMKNYFDNRFLYPKMRFEIWTPQLLL